MPGKFRTGRVASKPNITRLPTHSASPASQVNLKSCARVSLFTRGANNSIYVKVVLTDVLATNGVVHVIEDVLIPPGFFAADFFPYHPLA